MKDYATQLSQAAAKIGFLEDEIEKLRTQISIAMRALDAIEAKADLAFAQLKQTQE